MTEAGKGGHGCGGRRGRTALRPTGNGGRGAGPGEGCVRPEWPLEGPTLPTSQGKESQKLRLGETVHVLM